MPKRHFFRPVHPWRISQFFGENRACVDIATGTKFIGCDGHNPPEGYRSVYTAKGHTGLDIPCPRWTPIYAAYDGTVIFKETQEMRGLGIVIHHEIDGKFYLTKYWHLAAMDVDMGEKVAMGDFIGYADNTGWSSGDHLHFEIGLSNRDGSYYEPVDPMPYLHPTYALHAKNTIAWVREQVALITDKLSDYLRGR